MNARKSSTKSALPSKAEPSTSGGGVETIETGMMLLNALAQLSQPGMLKAIAAATGMPASKAHRYLVSLQRVGFVDRDERSGHYKLGAKAAFVGLAGLASADPVRLGTQIAMELRDRFDATALVSVWGNCGPTIVRIEEGSRPEINSRAGNVVSLLSSSSGRVFAAFLPQRQIRTILQQELKANARRGDDHYITSMAEAVELLSATRSEGMARIAGTMTPGVTALAAPICDYRGFPAAVVAITRSGAGSDLGLQGPIAKALRELTARASQEIGYGSHEPNGAPAGKEAFN